VEKSSRGNQEGNPEIGRQDAGRSAGGAYRRQAPCPRFEGAV
jgi:hypothetical protein